MNEFTLKKLEYNKIIEKLKNECSSSLGQEIAEKLRPYIDFRKIIVCQQETSEGVTVRRFEPQIPLAGIADIKKQIRKAEIGGILEPEELLKISDSLYAARKLSGFFLKKNKQYSSSRLDWWAKRLTIIKELEEGIEKVVSPEGQINDNASANLSLIRKKINTLQNRIKEKLDNIVRSENYQKYLQESLVTIRSDRYVVPIKQEYRSQVPGIIHDQSASGATLFIEPMVIVELNNDLRKLINDERDEITKILFELSQKVAEHIESLRENVEVLGQIDFIFAKARLSEKMLASSPKILGDGQVKIIKGRHPLISEKEVVPLTISLGNEFECLVITGPNTGGKTVTLKTVGLFVAMAQSGLHIPAEVGSEIGLFREVFADIGDEQSIEQSLSTFSSHMKNIVEILNNTDKSTLVLLDELGAGTDPTEGAALAIAILDFLIAKGAKIVATTHYSELKAYAFQEERVQNASVEFDVKTLQPTYRLMVGVPGKSNAFEIASRLGLNKLIINKARSLMSADEKNVAELIESLETNKLTAENNKKETEAKLNLVENKLRDVEKQEIKIKEEAEKILRKAEEEALIIIKNARKESENVIKEIRFLAKDEIIKAEQRALELKKNLVHKEDDLTEKLIKGPKVIGKKPKKVKVGQEVFVPKLNKNAVVITEVNNNRELQVQTGIIKITVNLDELEVVEKKKDIAKSGVGKIVSSKSENIRNELDFRGMNVDEAIVVVDKYLDDVFLSGLNQVSLIHGKGTGTLRNSIRDMLKKHPHVKTFRTGGFNEGGSGVTVVELKN